MKITEAEEDLDTGALSGGLPEGAGECQRTRRTVVEGVGRRASE